jgi:restriction-modification enzyme MmeI-like protein
LELELDPHFQLRLRKLVTDLPKEVFAADDSLGWTYQFWRAAEKKDVNERQVKIGADELPAVTQLFTEPYMVKFLLHNTLGAWWAGKLLAANPDLARNAPDENALREAYALPGVEWEYLRFVGQEDGRGPWRPAAGTFPGWPQRAAEITYCDPCCGSGHFLVEAFVILAALRQQQEGISAEEAAHAVLRDNLFGLEIDGRCVQIAAFNVALAAWRLAGGPVDLPVPHIAWVGAPPPLPKSEFMALAKGDGELERGLAALHDLFRQAPLLGSLIELTGSDLVEPTRIARIEQSIVSLLEKMRGVEPERTEGAIAARGMADAAAILSRRFTLQATNPPFLARFRQHGALAAHLAVRFNIAKANLATAMFTRMRVLAAPGGTVASVIPQNCLSQDRYKEFRKTLLIQVSWAAVATLGPRAFDAISGEVVNAALLVLIETSPISKGIFAGLDANDGLDPPTKAELLCKGKISLLTQAGQLRNPDTRITLDAFESTSPLKNYSVSVQGLATSDDPQFVAMFWELEALLSGWVPLRGTVESTCLYGGCERILLWEDGAGRYYQHALALKAAGRLGGWKSGTEARGKKGIIISQMNKTPVSLYCGEFYDHNACVIVPNSEEYLPAIFTFLSDNSFNVDVRRIDKSMKPSNNTFLAIPFDLARWQKVAGETYPGGLPEPYSDDPTQWLFHGHPCYAEGGTELHVAVARLSGYRWPAESDTEMRLSVEARAHIAEAATLPEADADGLLPLVPVLGERPLADRLRAYCAAAWGEFWTSGSEAALIASACERAKDRPPKQLTFDAWLRSHAARQHAKLFHDRPFLWWITDGRSDGFTVVAHYHRLDRANLGRIAYSMLNDWVDRQGDHPRAEAARVLQDKLTRILEGEKPYDIFVRWKPLERQPLGWEPDMDDGVRLNIRSFVEAKVLAHVPNVRYGVDRGKDVPSAPWYHLFNGERRNDHHTTLAEKRAARAKAAE